ncbi:unnamed protein product, partial [Durusdinium trenchii]
VERIDSTASESNLDLAHLVSNAVTEACREANLSIVGSVGSTPEEQDLVRSAVEAALRTELGERPDGAGTPVSVGGASYSAAHEAEVALFANRSVAEVLELVRSAVEGAVHNELASQAETRPGGGTPASVGGGSHSAAHDADVALLAQRSVQEVLHAVAQQSETPEVPVAPERSHQEVSQPIRCKAVPPVPRLWEPQPRSEGSHRWEQPQTPSADEEEPAVQHVETAASESNLDLAHLVSHAVTEACRDSNLSMIGSVGEVPEE